MKTETKGLLVMLIGSCFFLPHFVWAWTKPKMPYLAEYPMSHMSNTIILIVNYVWVVDLIFLIMTSITIIQYVKNYKHLRGKNDGIKNV